MTFKTFFSFQKVSSFEKNLGAAAEWETISSVSLRNSLSCLSPTVHPSILIPSFPLSCSSSTFYVQISLLILLISTSIPSVCPFFFSSPLSQPHPPLVSSSPRPLCHCESALLPIFPPFLPLASSCTSFPLLYTPIFTVLASFCNSFAPHSLLLFTSSSILLHYSDWVLFGMASVVPEYLSSHRAPWSITLEFNPFPAPGKHKHTHASRHGTHVHSVTLMNSHRHTHIQIPYPLSVFLHIPRRMPRSSHNGRVTHAPPFSFFSLSSPNTSQGSSEIT